MMDETKIHVYDNVMSDHDSQMISDIMSDTEFRWQYYHKSDPDQLVYHWHRLAGRTKKEMDPKLTPKLLVIPNSSYYFTRLFTKL